MQRKEYYIVSHFCTGDIKVAGCKKVPRKRRSGYTYLILIYFSNEPLLRCFAQFYEQS